MNRVQIFRSTLSFSRVRTLRRSSYKDFSADNNHQSLSPRDKGYSLDDMNNKGAFNNSSLGIVEIASLVEPSGWYLGRLYYVVIKGYTIGIFHEL